MCMRENPLSIETYIYYDINTQSRITLNFSSLFRISWHKPYNSAVERTNIFLGVKASLVRPAIISPAKPDFTLF